MSCSIFLVLKESAPTSCRVCLTLQSGRARSRWCTRLLMPARTCQVWAYGRLMHLHTELLAAAGAQALAILRVRGSGHRAPGHAAGSRVGLGFRG